METREREERREAKANTRKTQHKQTNDRIYAGCCWLRYHLLFCIVLNI